MLWNDSEGSRYVDEEEEELCFRPFGCYHNKGREFSLSL